MDPPLFDGRKRPHDDSLWNRGINPPSPYPPHTDSSVRQYNQQLNIPKEGAAGSSPHGRMDRHGDRRAEREAEESVRERLWVPVP
ncbi:hypothetical protein SKAU_G00333420 [Synaphobranchus kaupii]|uniref:Uncharacterized protein n=1 Tax=Synaphobranchus kaupii TaxID=118154 RepID=A0A9Q1ELJ4_SYNKA|nr:hypothetical protein SKAU_G00333420 [Synaphobranchus kaupii]